MPNRWHRSNIFAGDIVFSDFPQECRWRLVGFEAVHTAPLQPFERQVTFVFRQIVDGKVSGQPKRVCGPSGWLPYTLIGSEWEAGRRVSTISAGMDKFCETVDVSAAHLTDIHVFHHDATVVDATGRPINPHYWVPPFVHTFNGVTADHFRLIGIPRNGDPCGLLVPAYVLIQFYVATSTTLAQAVFTGGFRHLYDPTETRFVDKDNGIFRIRLSPGVPFDDAWVLARYVASPVGSPARMALNRIWSSLTRATVNGQPRLPAALFPFDGTTRLKASGLWLPGDPKGKLSSQQRFLILQIHRCSGPFPYKELEVLVDSPDPSGDAHVDGCAIPVLTSPLPATLSMVSNRRADPNRTPVNVPVPPAGTRFAALTGKTLKAVIKGRGDGTGSSSAIFVPGKPAECGATGPSAGDGTDVHPVEFEALPDIEVPPNDPSDHDRQPPAPRARGVATFDQMLDILETSVGIAAVKAIALDPPFAVVGTRTYGAIPAGNGRTWHLKDDKKTPRRLMLAEIRTAAGGAYAFDLEPKDDETTGAMMVAVARDGCLLSKVALQSIVAVIRKANRTWDSGSEDRKVRKALPLLSVECTSATFTAIGHTRSTAAEYAEQVLQILRQSALLSSNKDGADAEPKLPDQEAG